MTMDAPARSLDRRGRTITTFVVFDATTELELMETGEVLEIITDDFEPFESDIAAWCEANGHELVAADFIPEARRFLIQKGTTLRRDSRLAMVVSTDGLEELLSPLGFALGASLEGIDVHLFFQGPGVHVLKHGFKPKLGGWWRPFSRFAATGMARSGHIAARDKLTQMRSLGATIYICGPSMQRFKVEKEDVIFDDVKIVEYLTFMRIMEGAGINLYI